MKITALLTKALDPRTLKSEFEEAFATYKSFSSETLLDFETTTQKIAIFALPILKTLLYTSIISTIIFFTIPLTTLAIGTVVMLGIYIMALLAATYYTAPNTYSGRFNIARLAEFIAEKTKQI